MQINDEASPKVHQVAWLKEKNVHVYIHVLYRAAFKEAFLLIHISSISVTKAYQMEIQKAGWYICYVQSRK